MRFLIILLPVIFTIYTIVDCAKTDASEIRNLPKWAWLLIIIIIGTIGTIAYWIAGRPRRTGLGRPPVRRILPPDDDPDFLRKI
ncbi:MAG: PLDc N-terminal domain-containing protein [Actinomycetes bacterium]